MKRVFVESELEALDLTGTHTLQLVKSATDAVGVPIHIKNGAVQRLSASIRSSMLAPDDILIIVDDPRASDARARICQRLGLQWLHMSDPGSA